MIRAAVTTLVAVIAVPALAGWWIWALAIFALNA